MADYPAAFRAILSTVGIFALVQSWNNCLLPLAMLSSDSLYPWPLGIMQFSGEFSADRNLILAIITLTIAPAIQFFLLRSATSSPAC